MLILIMCICRKQMAQLLVRDSSIMPPEVKFQGLCNNDWECKSENLSGSVEGPSPSYCHCLPVLHVCVCVCALPRWTPFDTTPT